MTWLSGTFDNITIYAAKKSLVDVGGTEGNKNFNRSSFEVYSQLNWNSGNVDAQGLAPSSVIINQGGVFNIYATGYSWGLGMNYITTNHGTVNVSSSGVATLCGEYLTDSFTNVTAGTLVHADRAEQTRPAVGLGGTYNVAPGATVKVTRPAGGAGTLEIHEGGLVGGGTVDANLALGYNPADNKGQTRATSAYVGPTMAVGPNHPAGSSTITVTKNFVSYPGGAGAYFSCDANGNYTRLVVLGAATMDGFISFTRDVNYRPSGGDFVLISAA